MNSPNNDPYPIDREHLPDANSKTRNKPNLNHFLVTG
jgi:hypothetical protein